MRHVLDMKRKKGDEMIQTAVRLPQSLRDRLSRSGGERGLGEEIRRRLEASFGVEQQPRDQLTDLLLDLIKQIALNLSLDERWWTNRFAFDVFKAAINELLLDLISHIHPRNQPLPETVAKLQTRYGPDEKPETIGRIIARAVVVEHARDLLALQFADNQKG